MARRSPHIASHDLHEVEEHTEKDVIPKKDMYEFGRMNIQRIDSHTTRCTGQPPTVPLHPVIPCFLGTEHQEGGLALLWYQKDTTYVIQNAFFSGT